MTFVGERFLPLETGEGMAIPVVQEAGVYCIASYMTSISVMIFPGEKCSGLVRGEALKLDGPSGPVPSAAQGEEAQLLAYLNERVQQALLAAGVRVQSVCVESDEGKQGICAAVALVDDQMKQDAALVLDAFRLRYQLM